MMGKYATDVAALIRQTPPFALARMADVGLAFDGDAGAAWLTRVRDDIAEAIEYAAPECAEDVERWREDGAHEVADGAVPIYSADRWAVAGDLAAWQEDVSDYGESGDVLTVVSWALYSIAMRLVWAVTEDAVIDLARETDDTEGEA
jgi:hypothetical protein